MSAVSQKEQRLRSNHKLESERGMTLIEILIVLGLIAFLISFFLPKLRTGMAKANVSKTKLAMGQIMESLNSFKADCLFYPKTMESLTKSDPECSNWGPTPYLKKIPKDGWNRDFIYESSNGDFTLRSLGKDGIEGGDGENKDITQEDLQ